MSGSSIMFEILQSSYSSGQCTFRFCVPDEWYRRSRSRNLSSASFETSEATIKQLEALQESDEDEDDEAEEEGSESEDRDTDVVR